MKTFRNSLTFLVVVLLLLQLSWWSPANESRAGQAGRTPAYGWAEIMAIFSREKSLEEARLAKMRFEEVKEHILDELRAGRMDVRQASGTLLFHAPDMCPQYLTREPGETLEEKASRYLVGHLHKRAQLRLYSPEANASIEQLTAELEP